MRATFCGNKKGTKRIDFFGDVFVYFVYTGARPGLSPYLLYSFFITITRSNLLDEI